MPAIDTTSVFTGTPQGLIINSADVRGEIVFYLRHMANQRLKECKSAKSVRDTRNHVSAAATLNNAADAIEAATIL